MTKTDQADGASQHDLLLAWDNFPGLQLAVLGIGTASYCVAVVTLQCYTNHLQLKVLLPGARQTPADDAVS